MGTARGTDWTDLLELTTCLPLKRSDVAKCFDEANGCQRVRSADSLSSSLSRSYLLVITFACLYVWVPLLLPLQIYHKTICCCASFKAFPIFLFIRCTFCNKLATRSFIVATTASATAMAPQAFNFSLHFLLFKAKKNREEAEVRRSRRKWMKHTERHCEAVCKWLFAHNKWTRCAATVPLLSSLFWLLFPLPSVRVSLVSSL